MMLRASAGALIIRPRGLFQGRKGTPVSVTVRELAELVHGTVHGDGHRAVQAARPIGEARAGDITFLESDKHASQLVASAASAAVVAAPMPLGNKALIQVADPLMAFV